METQFNGAPHSSASADGVAPPPAGVVTGDERAPELLVRLTPWHRDLLENAIVTIGIRRPEPATITSAPADFWPDVFVPRKIPLAAFRQSALYHIFLITVLWGFSNTWLMRSRTVPVRDPFQHQTITYYSVSEYLPAIEIPSKEMSGPQEAPGEPRLAKQRIVSVPRDPNSRAQTIVVPPKVTLPVDVSIPNIIAWTPAAASVPLAAATHSTASIVEVLPTPVQPAPAVSHSASATRFDQQTSVVEPAPTVDNAELRLPASLRVSRAIVEPPPLVNARVPSPNLPLASAVEAVSSMTDVRRTGEINIARVDTAVAAPKLPVPVQRASGSLLHPQRPSTGASKQASAESPPPSLQMTGGGPHASQPVGQLLALGINPAVPNGPIPVPRGSRTGTFAAGPDGKSEGRGTPDHQGGGTGYSQRAGSGNGGGGSYSTSPLDGLSVAPGLTKPMPGVVVAGTPKPAQEGPKTLASMMRPKVADIARTTTPLTAPTTDSGKIEDEVFAGKKYYSMTLNMPNLVSASGSWIIRFAELHAGGPRGELTAPIAMQKVDPAYPTELMRQHVEGTVVLYAIIHADGTVADVRVLHGVDDRLDQNARVALMKWRFRPGTKNGSAIDLEAVVQIPFVARQLPF